MRRRGLRFFSPLSTESKRATIAQRTGAYAANIIAEVSKKPGGVDRAADVLKAFALTHGTPEDITKAISILRAEGIPLEVAFSRVGGEFGMILRDIMSDGGKFIPAQFLETVKKSTNAEELLTAYGSKLDKSIDTLYPAIKDAKLGVQGKIVQGAEKISNTGLYKGSRTLFGSIYMGYNPGYFVRAVTTDTFHLFADVGLSPLLDKGRLFRGSVVDGELGAMFDGNIPKAAAEGFSQSGEKTKGMFGIRPLASEGAEKFQAQASKISYWDGAKKSFRSLHAGLAKETFGTLKDAGVSDDFLKLMQRKLNELYDIDKVRDWAKGALQKGYIDDPVGWIDDVPHDMLDRFHKLDDYRAAMTKATTLEEKVAAHNEILQDMENYAKEAARVPSRLPANLADDAYDEASKAVHSGYFSDNTYSLSNTQRIANVNTEDAFEDVLTELKRLSQNLGIDTKKIKKLVPQTDARHLPQES